MCGTLRVGHIITFTILLFFISGIQGEEEEEDLRQFPRGVYHFSDLDREIETSFKVPDFGALDPIKMASDLMSSAIRTDTKRKTLAGIELPFSFTGRPMSIQINGETHNAVNLVDPKAMRKSEKPKEIRRSPESRQTFLKARQICLEESIESCDEALDTLYQLRFGKSLVNNDEEGEDNNGEYRKIIEDKIKEIGTNHEDSEEDYHDKARNFLRQIN
ncbi:unnamed protein product [Caenorhabditis angaria]|uniref:Uncharacterized protein n=1 Tax=Caenorhabditis angaria TaxID=860376 RepID=A0A9P1I3W2_9PELO|nr:unnamed protein product [Caenorhabditis angaria]